MKVSILLAAVLFALAYITFVQCASSTPVPLFLWSGKHYQYFKKRNTVCNGQKQVLDKILKAIVKQEKSSYLKGLDSKPEAIVFFIHEALGSDDFMRFAGSFASHNKNSFQNLRNAVASSSLTFPSCKVNRGENVANSIYATLSQFSNAVSVTYVNENSKTFSTTDFVNQLESGKTALKAGKINVFLVIFDEIVADHDSAFAAHDATMHKIVNKVSELTSGNFIAGFTAVHGADVEEVSTLSAKSDLVVFNTAALQQTSNTTTDNSTTTTNLYMDETLVGAMLIMLIMLGLVIAAFSFVADIKTGPHISDLITPEQDTKKSR